MPSSHLILCRPLLLPSSIFPSIRVFSNESALHIRWPKYWNFSFRISPSNEYSGLISFRMDWLDLLAVQGTLKSLLQHHSSKASILWCSAFFIVQLSHPYKAIILQLKGRNRTSDYEHNLTKVTWQKSRLLYLTVLFPRSSYLQNRITAESLSKASRINGFMMLFSGVWLFETPWTAARQASLYFTISQSLLKFMSIEWMMLSNHLILCYPLLLCLQSFLAWGSFPMSWLFTSGGQSASVLPLTIQGWFPSRLTSLISL